MIEAKNLSMCYGPTKALNDVSFTVKDKEIVGLLGPNGAGKSTIMRLLTTFIYPTGGTAIMGGHDVTSDPVAARRAIGYLPETPPLYMEMRVDEFLDFVGRARGLGGATLKARKDWTVQACGVSPVWKHTMHELSLGYRQRVGLAQAILHDPAILILDEPTSGLDPLQIIEIRNLIRELAQTKTILFSTHILQEASAVSNRLLIINQGAIVAQGPIDTLVEQFFPTARVEVEVVGPPPVVRDMMRAIPGVVSVHDEAVTDGAGRYVVESARGRDIRGEISRLAAQQHWSLLELKRVGTTLEEVFIRIVAGEETAAEAGEEAAP